MQSNLCTTTTLRTPKLWPLLTFGRCSLKMGKNGDRCGDIVAIRRWSLTHVWLYSVPKIHSVTRAYKSLFMYVHTLTSALLACFHSLLQTQTFLCQQVDFTFVPLPSLFFFQWRKANFFLFLWNRTPLRRNVHVAV